MEVIINNQSVIVPEGAKVIDAVRAYFAANGMECPTTLPRISDAYYNRISPDGRLNKGARLFIKQSKDLKGTVGTLVCICFLLLMSGCGAHRSTVATPPQTRSVHILAVNDIHAAVDKFPRFAFIADSLRQIYPDMLLVSGGDNQTGNSVNDQYSPKGLPIIELMNAVKFDLSAVGNHEFDTGHKEFSYLLGAADFDFICANLTPPSDGEFPIRPYKLIKMPNGLTLGVVSVLSINSGGIPDSHPDKVRGWGFADPYDVALQYLHLKDSCDLLIYLNHLGYESDVELAKKFPVGAVDLIIGGHSHTRIARKQEHNGVLITQADSKLKYASLITLDVGPDGTVRKEMKLLTVRDNGSVVPAIRTMVEKYNDNPALKEEIADLPSGLSSRREVGYLMVDALRAQSKCDFAIINAGGVRVDELPKGKITVRDVYMMDPFGNEMVVFDLTGEEILSLFKWAYGFDKDTPLYVSGLHSRYTVEPSGALVDIELLDEQSNPLDLSRTYSIAMNSYISSVYKFEGKERGRSLYRTSAEATIEYLRHIKSVQDYTEVHRTEIIKKK